MPELNKLSFVYQERAYKKDKQQEVLRHLIEPILRERYRDKMESLNLKGDFLTSCQISRPFHLVSSHPTGKQWNTRVCFKFPETHRLLKGKVEVAYTRTDLATFFNQPQIPDGVYETFATMDNEQYQEWWWNLLKRTFGKYFEEFGVLTSCCYGKSYNTQGKTLVFQVPKLVQIREAFHPYLMGYPYPVSFPFECRLYSTSDYAILDDTMTFTFNIVKENTHESSSTSPVLP